MAKTILKRGFIMVLLGIATISVGQGNRMKTRLQKNLMEYDSQGWHRTGTEGSLRAARWIEELVLEMGLQPNLIPIEFMRQKIRTAFVEIDGRRVHGLPLFDGGATSPEGVVGTLGEVGSGADFWLLEKRFWGSHGTGMSTKEIIKIRKEHSKKGYILITTGDTGSGVSANNADLFPKSLPSPVIQLDQAEEAWLTNAIKGNKKVRIVVDMKAIPALDYNIEVRIPGSDPSLQPVIVTTPLGAWWESTAERGCGLVLWLEMMRHVHEANLANTFVFIGTTGHELGNFGIKHYLLDNANLVKNALVSIHLGASLGASENAKLGLYGSSNDFQINTANHLVQAGIVRFTLAKTGIASGESKWIQDAGGAFISLTGPHHTAHLKSDRWPDAVDLDKLVRYTEGFCTLADEIGGRSVRNTNSEHMLVGQVMHPKVEGPVGKRMMGGRMAFPIIHSSTVDPTVLNWPKIQLKTRKAILRMTAAVDHRVAHEVEVSLAKSKTPLGKIEVLFACPGQVFELMIEGEQLEGVFREGIALRIADENQPLWMVSGGEKTALANLPHLYFIEETTADNSSFLNLFCSWASLQPCDWMGVCVLDGLRDWSLLGRSDAAAMLESQLKTYFRDDGQFVREDFRGKPADNKAGGVEQQGPFAVLAQINPEHPAMHFFKESVRLHYNESVNAVAHDALVAESAYNIAYPMMALGIATNNEGMQLDALQQLRMNKQHLWAGHDLWLRYFPGEDRKDFKNWSRGAAWYFLGLVRTLALLPPGERPVDLVLEVQKTSRYVKKHQQPNGLWPCFLDEPGVIPDTSGSAGLAAAIAIAVKNGLLDDRHLEMSIRAAESLEKHLAPGGWLLGASQSNKRETRTYDIQRIDFRVIAPWGMGLYAQLLAALAGERTGIID